MEMYEKLFIKSGEVDRLTSFFLIIVGGIFVIVSWIIGLKGFFWFGEGLILSVCAWNGFKLLILSPYWRMLLDNEFMKIKLKELKK